MIESQDIRFIQGNAAMVEGAITAGAKFYAGYPITPSSEIAEISSIRLPQEGGLYIQMEDEIASIAAIIGASAAGKKSYTATSGPGFSLMQENLGVAIMAELPCVIINVQRSGPSTGLATKPAQGDFMQSRWGTHGDHGIIVLSPSTAQDCFDLMIDAFNYAEKYRTPVVFLADEIIGHIREKVVIRKMDESEIINRTQPVCKPEEYQTFNHSFDNTVEGIAPLAPYGGKYLVRLSGSTHDESGIPCSQPDNADKFIRHYTDKIEKNYKDIVKVRKYNLEDSDIVLITFGASARSSIEAMNMARNAGKRVGVLQLVTLWPFPEDEVREALKNSNAVIAAELNLGQMIREVQRLNDYNTLVQGVNKVDSTPITPKEILDKIAEVENESSRILG